MAEILTESFCERCGTRYTFEAAAARRRPFGRIRTLSRGVKNFVANDDSSFADAMAAARDEDARGASMQQLDAFHRTFNFCLSCRQYTCRNCWNAAVGECLSCAPDLNLEVLPAQFINLAPANPAVEDGVAEEPLADFRASVWPIADRRLVIEPIPELAALEGTPIAASDIELTASELVAIEGALSRHVHRYEPLPDAPPAGPDRDAPSPELVAETIAAESAASPIPDVEAPRAPELAGPAAESAASPIPDVDAPELAGPAAEVPAAALPALAIETVTAPELAGPAADEVSSAPAAPVAEGMPASVAPDLAGPGPEVTAPRASSSPTEAGRAETRRLFQRFRPRHDRTAAAFSPTPEVWHSPAIEASVPSIELTDAAAAAIQPAEPAVELLVGPAAPEPREPVAAAEPALPVAAPKPPDVAAVVAAVDRPAASEPAAEPGPPTVPPVDVAVQPTWRMVAPDGTAADEIAPDLPTWASAGRTGRRRDDAMPTAAWAARVATARPVESPVWEASSRDILAAPAPGTAVPGIHACVSCGLSLSANARFCRRCGSLQG